MKKQTLADLLNKKYKRQIAFYGNDFISLLNEDPISTGVACLDYITSGGFPAGRLSEVYGEYSSGKTLICLNWLAQIQQMGGTAVFFQLEDRLTAYILQMGGVDINNFHYIIPDSLEEMYDICRSIIREAKGNEPDRYYGIVVDSIAQADTCRDSDTIEDRKAFDTMEKAKTNAVGMRKIAPLLPDSRIGVILVNQERTKVSQFGSYTEAGGGKAVKFTVSLSIRLSRGKKIKSETGEIIGQVSRVQIVKSKVSPPFSTCEFTVIFKNSPGVSGGIIPFSGFLELMVERGKIIGKGGGHYEIADPQEEDGITSEKFTSSAGSLHSGFEDWISDNVDWVDRMLREVREF